MQPQDYDKLTQIIERKIVEEAARVALKDTIKVMAYENKSYSNDIQNYVNTRINRAIEFAQPEIVEMTVQRLMRKRDVSKAAALGMIQMREMNEDNQRYIAELVAKTLNQMILKQ